VLRMNDSHFILFYEITRHNSPSEKDEQNSLKTSGKRLVVLVAKQWQLLLLV